MRRDVRVEPRTSGILHRCGGGTLRVHRDLEEPRQHDAHRVAQVQRRAPRPAEGAAARSVRRVDVFRVRVEK